LRWRREKQEGEKLSQELLCAKKADTCGPIVWRVAQCFGILPKKPPIIIKMRRTLFLNEANISQLLG